LGRVDTLYGFKENVIMGHLIPGGTGFPMFRNIKLVPLAEPIPEEELRQESEAVKKAQELLG
jgi:DNA-directed RNA polymerase subunit beta'